MHIQPHPVVTAAAAVEAALENVADVDPVFMPTADKKAALLALDRVSGRLEELRLRVMAAADDVAVDEGARDVAAWLAHHGRRDRGETRRDLRLADALDTRRQQTRRALREGVVSRPQAEVIVRALDALPGDLDPDLLAQAEERLVAESARFGPRQLRILGRRILDVLAPEVAEDHERRALEREEAHALAVTALTSRRRGDGTTDLHIRTADLVADRLFTYLEAFTSPRLTPGDRRPYDQKLGHAFAALLESIDPTRLPLHGGDATTVIVTLDLDRLRDGLGTALVGDAPITAAAARRLACTAQIIPTVLGGKSEILDLGRARRLFSPAQRKAMAIRDVTCRAEGCDIPAAWCEAHHAAAPWTGGGRTDLADGLLLCCAHHHRAHDHRYDTRRLPTGQLRFHRRT
jgi:Domain of unknown function (DUF222)